MKKIVGFVFALAVLTLGGCGNSEEATPHHPQTEQSEMMQTSEEVLDIVPIVDEVEESEDTTESQIEEIPSMIFAEGNTLETRIAVPKDYERVSATEESLTAFLRAYPMKEDKSPVLLYDGREKGNQSAHAAVFSLPIEEYDLQQCR